MGVELFERRDLVVEADHVYMQTTDGLQRVDVIYRRIDDTFLDAEVLREDSVLGVVFGGGTTNLQVSVDVEPVEG